MDKFDTITNLAISSLTNAPGTTGTSFGITTGDGAKFPTTVPFEVVYWPSGQLTRNTGASATTAEFGTCTAISGDTLTITRNSQPLPGGALADVAIGHQIAAVPSAKRFNQVERSIATSTSFYNVTATSLDMWRAALSKAYAGTGFANIICYGDSIMGGYTGGETAGSADQQNVYSQGPVGRLRALFQQLVGVGGDGVNWMFHSGGLTATGTYSDPRIVLSAATNMGTGNGVFGYSGIQVSGTGQSFTFTPNGQYDSIDVYYQKGNGIFTVQIGTQAAVQVDAVAADAANPIGKRTVASTDGAVQAAIKITGNGTAIIWAIRSTRGASGVLVSQCQLNGRHAENLVWGHGTVASTENNADGSLSQAFNLPDARPDLSIICYGANEKHQYGTTIDAQGVTYQTRTPADYKNYVQKLITRARQTGDVLLVVPPFYNTTSGTYTNDQFRAKLYELADENDVALFDTQKRWNSFATAQGQGFYFDDIHPTYRGHWDITAGIYSTLTYHTGVAMPMRSIQGLPPVTTATTITNQKAVVNSTAEHTLMSYVIPANTLAVGTMYSFKFSGTILSNAAASATLTLSIKLNTAVVAQIAFTTAKATVYKGFWAQGMLTTRAIGASGAVVGSVNLLESLTTTKVWVADPASSVTVETNRAATLSVTAQWGTASTNYDLRVENGNIILDRM